MGPRKRQSTAIFTLDCRRLPFRKQRAILIKDDEDARGLDLLSL